MSKSEKHNWEKMGLLRFRSLRKIFRSNVGCADLSQAWWCCLPLSDWHVPLSLPRRTTQAQSRATAKTRIVFQSILPKTLSSVYLVRQTTLLGFVLSIGGPARSPQVNHLRQEDLLVTLEPKLCQEKASMSHLSIFFTFLSLQTPSLRILRNASHLAFDQMCPDTEALGLLDSWEF